MKKAIKRICGCKGSYKWAKKQIRNNRIVKRKKSNYRITENYIFGTIIIYECGFVPFNKLARPAGLDWVLNKEVADYYTLSKEDEKALDWILATKKEEENVQL